MGPQDRSKIPKKSGSSDPRFADSNSNPLFRIPKRQLNRQKIDERFKSKLENDEDFQKKPTIDKYGRKLNTPGAKQELGKYYNLDDEKNEEDEESSGSSEESGSDSSDEEEPATKKQVGELKKEKSAEEKEEELRRYRRARGELSDDESSSDDDSSDEESEAEELVVEENEIPMGDETTTLAAVNMDWDNIRAVDLMVAFSSFVPASGRISSVRIYPSEYGKEKMKQETISGPPKELFDGKKRKSDESDDEDEEKEDRPLFGDDNGEDFQSDALRKYQLQRLRYYYAVIKCSNISTARNIYENCDGAEYEATANVFDLRYVPEGTEFEDKPRDECTVVPANYQLSEYSTDALRHSKVRLTWDETPTERMKLASRAFSRKEIEGMDLQAYIASDSDESDEEDKEAKKNMYKSLLQTSDYSSVFNGEDKKDVDMEITFSSGLDGAKKKNEEEDETTIEKYKRQMKERRKKHQEKTKDLKEAEKQEEKKKSKKNKKGSEQNDKDTAELELLMTEDNDEERLKHFNMKEIIKAEKKANRKGKKGKKNDTKDAPEGMDFEMDVGDSRFTALYDDHDFAIDPTKPQFKKTKDMERIMTERRKRAAEQYEENGANSAPKEKKKSIAEEKKSKKRKMEAKAGDKSLSALVDKVKRRAKLQK